MNNTTKQGEDNSLSDGVSTVKRNNTTTAEKNSTTLLNDVTEQCKKRKSKKRKRHRKRKSKKRKRNNTTKQGDGKSVFDSPSDLSKDAAAKTPNLPTVQRNNTTNQGDDCSPTDWKSWPQSNGLVTPSHSQEQKASHS